MTGPAAYAANAAAMFSVVGAPLQDGDLALTAAVAGGCRVVARRRPAPGELAAMLAPTGVPAGRRVVEVPFEPPPDVAPPADATVLRMPVMVRPPGPPPAAPAPPGISVGAVAGAAELAEAERVIVDGFPQRHLQPWRAGQALPPRVLDRPGWTGWLARDSGTAVAAAYTYDDGETVGVYWLATLPGWRGRGVGRVVMASALAACPDRPATLTATDAGVPLYERLGFATVGQATWYIDRVT